ncbi:MAG: hypothetical protein IPJ77_05395 [Planctomycetes bacterium]|nr:hypothetical protein [Planctomycetota bacterium]
MTLTLVLGLLVAARSEPSAPPLALVRFTCDERVAARRAERAWRAPAVVDELARGWSVDVRDACEHAEEFERLVGERGVLAACALDARGTVVGVLRGPAPAEQCVEFLDRCRDEARRAHEARSEDDTLARLDARIALGAWSAARAELDVLDCADERAARLSERRARLHALQGDVRRAEHALAASRATGFGDDARASRRADVTAALIALAARRLDAVRALLPIVLADVEDAPCERDALVRIAQALHESGADELALDVAAALEAARPTTGVLRALDALREHVARGPVGHAH